MQFWPRSLDFPLQSSLAFPSQNLSARGNLMEFSADIDTRFARAHLSFPFICNVSIAKVPFHSVIHSHFLHTAGNRRALWSIKIYPSTLSLNRFLVGGRNRKLPSRYYGESNIGFYQNQSDAGSCKLSVKMFFWFFRKEISKFGVPCFQIYPRCLDHMKQCSQACHHCLWNEFSAHSGHFNIPVKYQVFSFSHIISDKHYKTSYLNLNKVWPPAGVFSQ